MAVDKYIPLPKKVGAPKKIESPDLLWDLAQQYFEYSDNNPWLKNELIKSGPFAGVVLSVPTRVPYTWSGLEVFCLKMGYNTRLDEYKSNRKGGYEEFSDICKAIGKVMFSQKFEGAGVGAFNANLIARELGLAEKTVTEIKDKTDDFDYNDLDDSALEQIAAARQKAKDLRDDNDDEYGGLG